MREFSFYDGSGTSWLVSEWLILLVGFVALSVVITWPAVKGKWCLVVSMSLILLPAALICLQPYFTNRWVIDEAGHVLMGPEEYQDYWMFSMIMVYLSLFGKFLFVAAMFRLRSQFRIFLERISTDNDAR